MDKESKATFNFNGLQDRSMPRARAEDVQSTVQEEPVKKVRKEATVTGTKKLVLNKPKY